MAKVQSGSIRYAQRNIWRGVANVWRDTHRALTLTTLIGSCLLIQLLVIFSLVAFGTQAAFSARANVRLEFTEAATSQEMVEFRAELDSLDSVSEAVYIPKEKAYEQMRLYDPELIETVEGLSLGNPFPNSVSVTPLSLSAYQDIRQLIDEDPWQSLLDPAALTHVIQVEQSVADLQTMVSSISALITLFVELTIGILLCTITTILALRFRRRGPQISMQYLLGAHASNIALPLISEGLALMILSMAVSMGAALGIIAILPLIGPYVGATELLNSIQDQLTTMLPVWMPQLLTTELLVIIFLVLIATVFALTGKKIVRPALV